MPTIIRRSKPLGTVTMPLEQTINTEPLLTIMGIVAAAWAIIPRTRLLQISLNLSWIDWTLTGFALLLANYLTFEPLLSSFNLYYSIGPWLPGLDSASATYLIFVAWLSYVYLRSRFGHLPRSNTKKLKELVDRLIATRQYDELALIIEPQLDKIIQLSDEIHVHNTIQNITNNNDLTNHPSLAHPNICLKLIKTYFVIPTDFSDRFIEAIVNNTGSQLYTELKIIDEYTPEIDKNTPIIKELLSNPYAAANQYGIESIILNMITKSLDSKTDLVEELNPPALPHTNKNKQLYPINASISMLNIMMHEAIKNGYQGKIYMFTPLHIVECLIKYAKDVYGGQEETNCPIYILMDKIISYNMNWIEAGIYVKRSQIDNYQKHMKTTMQETNSRKQYGHIKPNKNRAQIDVITGRPIDSIHLSKISANLLGQVVQQIIESTKIIDKWKHSILQTVIIKHKEMTRTQNNDNEQEKNNRNLLGDLVFEHIINGSIEFPKHPAYRETLYLHAEYLDKKDSKPLRDRLLKAIAEDKARESSH